MYVKKEKNTIAICGGQSGREKGICVSKRLQVTEFDVIQRVRKRAAEAPKQSHNNTDMWQNSPLNEYASELMLIILLCISEEKKKRIVKKRTSFIIWVGSFGPNCCQAVKIHTHMQTERERERENYALDRFKLAASQLYKRLIQLERSHISNQDMPRERERNEGKPNEYTHRWW